MRLWGLDQGWKGVQVAKLIGSRGEEHLVHGNALVALQVDTALLPLSTHYWRCEGGGGDHFSHEPTC